MSRAQAESERDRLQRDDHQHTYVVRERSADEWEVVRIDLPRPPARLVAEQGKPVDAPEDLRPSSIRQIPPFPGFG